MGYMHYWYREKEIDPEEFNLITADFRKLLPKFEEIGVKLANGFGENEPVINSNLVWFNGLSNCGHPKNHEIILPWPSKSAGGVNTSRNSLNGHWYAGAQIQSRCCDGDCSYETFCFERVIEPNEWQEPKNGLYFECCKTAFRPYDLAVTAFLIIAKHYLKDKIVIRSDGEQQHWFDAILLCSMELGYGLDFDLAKAGVFPQYTPVQPKVEPKKEKTEIIYESAKETAKKIRVELKKRFPGVKFSVRSKVFSGGDSVDIDWTDGPTTKEVEEITRRFESGSFDGMTDSYNYSYYEYEGKKYIGAKYISCQRTLSEEYKKKLEEFAKNYYTDFNPNSFDYWRYLNLAEEKMKEKGII